MRLRARPVLFGLFLAGAVLGLSSAALAEPVRATVARFAGETADGLRFVDAEGHAGVRDGHGI